jgi:alpha-D-ribose 1-methylphosphonate 5-triphosphate synthase subunit PhnG
MTEHERVQYWWKRALDAEAKLKPKRVTTAAEAEALPIGSVIRTEETGLVQEKARDGAWWVTGHSAQFRDETPTPATVLYLP